MSVLDYISKHPVFTTADIQAITPSKETAETLLRRAVASGRAERIRRGLYASRSGVFQNEAPSPFDVIRGADPNAVLSYRSALLAHGLSHNASFDMEFRTDKVKHGFEFRGVRYTPLRMKPGVQEQSIRTGLDSFSKVTTREQTFVDCLSNIGRAGGAEEVIRALSSIAYLDVQELSQILERSSGAVRARAGWLLEMNKEKWEVPDDYLNNIEKSIKGGPVRFGSKKGPSASWSTRWKLSLPFEEEEINGWVG